MYMVEGIVIVSLLLILPVGIVLTRRAQFGDLSAGEASRAVAGICVSGLAAFACFWGSFALAGGPDARFLSRDSLLFGAVGMLLSLVLIGFGLRLLKMPVRFAALFVVPAIATVIAQAVGVWQITLAALFVGPLLCLFLIVGWWARRELKLVR